VRTYAIPTGRWYERKPAHTPVTLIVASNGSESRHCSTVVDTSDGGLRLKVDAPLTPGQIVLLMSGDRSKSAVRGRVVWAREQYGGQWEAGLELLQQSLEAA
jgi:PilZ domain